MLDLLKLIIDIYMKIIYWKKNNVCIGKNRFGMKFFIKLLICNVFDFFLLVDVIFYGVESFFLLDYIVIKGKESCKNCLYFF